VYNLRHREQKKKEVIMYPLLRFNKQQIYDNTVAVVKRAAAHDVDITAITKCTAANPDIAEAFLKGGATALGDSRIRNLRHLQDFKCNKWLIRIPMLSEVQDTVMFSTLSLNSEYKTIEALNEAATKYHKIHDILLMVDVGDLREGYFNPNNLYAEIEKIKQLRHIRLRGVGANSTCIGATIPSPSTYNQLADIQHHLIHHYGIPCDILSAGNSSAYYMIENHTMPSFVTNLRIGELILFGNETSFGKKYEYMHSDNFILEVEIVELKEKPSVPIGKIGIDAFGNKPSFEDKGVRKRAILGIGKQDTSIDDLTPLDQAISIIGASSDHLVIDVTDSDKPYHVGDIVNFRCNYVSALHASTSSYLEAKKI